MNTFKKIGVAVLAISMIGLVGCKGGGGGGGKKDDAPPVEYTFDLNNDIIVGVTDTVSLTNVDTTLVITESYSEFTETLLPNGEFDVVSTVNNSLTISNLAGVELVSESSTVYFTRDGVVRGVVLDGGVICQTQNGEVLQRPVSIKVAEADLVDGASVVLPRLFCSNSTEVEFKLTILPWLDAAQNPTGGFSLDVIERHMYSNGEIFKGRVLYTETDDNGAAGYADYYVYVNGQDYFYQP